MTALIILAIGGWLSFAGMTVVARVLALILRDKEWQIAHLKEWRRELLEREDAQWEAPDGYQPIGPAEDPFEDLPPQPASGAVPASRYAREGGSDA